MGSFYVADGITQLPITNRDKLRAFILLKKGEMEGGGTCYPYDLWAPFTSGVQAQYYDYGKIYKVVEDDLTWLYGRGEQDYWYYMECREQEEKGSITATYFNYHKDNKFLPDNVIETVCGRINKIKAKVIE